MESYSTYIFIAVIMSGVGYMATRTRNFNIWKMGLIAFVAAPVVMNLGNSKIAIWVAVISFFAGFMLPHAHILDGFFRALNDLVNSIRFRSDRRNIESQKEELRRKEEELRRREEELERLRREYEEAMNRARSKQDSAGGRKQERQENSEQKRSGAGSENSSSSQRKPNNPQRNKHLETLGLDPNNTYTETELTRWYRNLLFKYHPDKHQGKSEDEIKRITRKMQDIIAAYEWLKQNPDK